MTQEVIEQLRSTVVELTELSESSELTSEKLNALSEKGQSLLGSISGELPDDTDNVIPQARFVIDMASSCRGDVGKFISSYIS